MREGTPAQMVMVRMGGDRNDKVDDEEYIEYNQNNYKL